MRAIRNPITTSSREPESKVPLENEYAGKAKRINIELESLPKAKAAFIEPMLLLRSGALPEAAEWLYELKLDGYRAPAINSAHSSAI